jgi:glycosyltransferase involved in cell wall biosynthesis
MGDLEPSSVRVSLVIPTRNRASQLRVCLDSLLKLRCARQWQLVIVDNGSTDDTRVVLKQFAGGTRFRFDHLFEPAPGASHARNAGWRAARGEFVAFIDDDCYPDMNFLDAIVDVFDENPALGFAGGRVLLFDSTDYPITIQLRDHRLELEPNTVIPAGLIHTANCTIRRRALEDIGGFDPLLGAGTGFVCEDVDVLARILWAGWPGAFDPRLVVYHHHQRQTADDAYRLARAYDRGRGAYYAKSLLDPSRRAAYFRAWMNAIRWQPVAVTARELTAAVSYLATRLTTRETE